MFIVPIGMAAWNHHQVTAYGLSVILPISRVFLELGAGTARVNAINTVVRILTLSLFAYFICRTSVQKKEIRKLEGILPVCALCKKIRNEHGEYEEIEEYISRHSEASFSHGLCKECARKLYPEFIREEDE